MGIRKNGRKTLLTHEEHIKQIQMMTGKNHGRINKRINDDINHNNLVIT